MATMSYGSGEMRRRMAASLVAGLLAAATLGLGACRDARLFPEEQPRSQYQRYSDLRGHERQAKTTNAWGQERKALEQRLRPLGQ